MDRSAGSSTSASHIAAARADNIAAAFARSAARHGPRMALRFGQREWTYAQLEQAITGLAHALRALGLASGERVAAFGANSDAYVLLWLACARAGLVHVPINHGLTADEVDYILRQSGSRALFHDPGDLERLAHAADAVQWCGTLHGGSGHDVLAMASAEPGQPRQPLPTPAADDLAQILYTSGTTAAPKGAMLTHAALLAEYTSAIIELELSAHDRALAALPLYHSAQMHVFTVPQLIMGGYVHILASAQAELCLSTIAQQRLDSFFAPPTVWISLLRHPGFDGFDLSCLKRGYYGASIMPVPVLEELARRLPVRLFNCYGQSEIGPLATVLRPEDHAQRPASAGRPVFNVQTRVVDADGQPVAPGEQGEIVHRSPQLLRGYWDKPEETAEAFAGGWFHTGDLGVMDAEGYLTIVDRVKDVINSGGIVVSSREVEECLYRHPAVAEVAVFALPDPRLVEAVAAVVALKDGMQADEAELIAHARAHLAHFKAPRRVFFRDGLPRNGSGKLLKRELRQEYGQR